MIFDKPNKDSKKTKNKKENEKHGPFLLYAKVPANYVNQNKRQG